MLTADQLEDGGGMGAALLDDPLILRDPRSHEAPTNGVLLCGHEVSPHTDAVIV